jgi:dihydropteroate synthase
MDDKRACSQARPFDFWRCGRHAIDLSRPRVMGIVNVTPDSFADGGRYADASSAIAHAKRLIDDGADIIDVGGESTRPGALPVGEAEEIDRVLPVVCALARDGAIVSVDTRHAAVTRAAIAEGASIVNDVQALRDAGALDACAASDVGVVLMHMRGDPATMQAAPAYEEVVAEVRAFLRERADACLAAGIARERIAVDPGFGFGKTVEHNLTLLRALPRIVADGFPVLAGLSRKSTLGKITGRAVDERVAASVAAALLAVERGASIVRVHDVRDTVDALNVWRAVVGSA